MKIVSSIGVFGNLKEVFGNMSYAIQSLINEPFNDRSFLIGLFRGSGIFIRESLFTVTSSVSSVINSIYEGANYFQT